MRVLLLLNHEIEEHDQVRLLSELGYDVLSIGAYLDPAHTLATKRPSLPDAPSHPDLKAIVDSLGAPDNLDAAKEHIPDAILDWAEVIILHHYPERFLLPQWDRLKGKRVIWRTVGQSTAELEYVMGFLKRDGLEIVRYSPKERNLPNYAGEDAVIRFYKDPAEWYGWTGEDARVITICQDLLKRDPFTNYGFWAQATDGLPSTVIGPGSEQLGGPGAVSLDEMKGWLRRARCYLYTGTQPASYTLGLIEAMMTGIPVVSIGPSWMRMFPWGPDVFEGHEIVGFDARQPEHARNELWLLLDDRAVALMTGRVMRQRAIDLFGIDTIKAQWLSFLGPA